ncbi:MAG: class I SAM-dependent methyltransferase [Planctomycetota bacterium]|jgi:SAM-dependent methyltransferase
MFQELEQINRRPEPFEFYTAADLWSDEHTSKQMLACHLNPDVDLSSRKEAFIDRSTAWIASHFHVGPGVKIADFGAGPGLYTTRLARLGAGVTGIDFSQRSIEYARKTAADEGLSVEYVNEDYLHFETEDRFDLVLMIMCDFCALSPAQRRTMLAKFHHLLRPGGAVLLDGYSLHGFEGRESGASYGLNLLDGFWSAEKYYGFLNTFKYEKEKVVLDKYTLIEAGRTRVVYNWLQYFSPDRLREEFEASGLIVETFFSDVAGSPFDPEAEEFAVVGRKG